MTTTGVRTRLDSLTALRFIAAALVVGHHAWTWDDGSAPAVAEAVFYQGPVGVSFFFVLSGFVLTWSRRKGDRPAEFYRRRFARIYPAYFVVWVAATVLAVVSGGFRIQSFAALTLLQAWVPAESIFFAGNAVFWTLSCEAFFYAVFPYVIARLKRRRTRSLKQLLVLVVTAHMAIVAAVAALPVPRELERWVIGFFPPFRLLEFVAGICVALLIQRAAWPRVPVAWAAALFVAAYAVAGLVPFALMRTFVTLIPIVLLVGATAQRDIDGRPPFSAKWLVRLGVWSYSLYLVHPVVLTVADKVVGDFAGQAAAVVVGAVGSLVAAALLFKLVEEPMERRLRGAGRRSVLAP